MMDAIQLAILAGNKNYQFFFLVVILYSRKIFDYLKLKQAQISLIKIVVIFVSKNRAFLLL